MRIDYLIEPEAHGEPTGIQIAIQLKGIASSESDGKMRVQVKTKHLVYYIQKVRIPVFLVAIDVKRRRGFWLSLQECAKGIAVRALKRQRTITLNFPSENELSSPALLKAIYDADNHMRELWRGSVPAAMRMRKEGLERAEPRVEVDVECSEGSEHLKIKAKQPFQLGIKVNSEFEAEVRAKLNQLVETGEEMTVPKGSITFVGSPVFETINEVAKLGTLKLKTGREIAIEICLHVPTVSEMLPIVLPATIRIGTQASTIQSRMDRSPLVISFRVECGRLHHFAFPLRKSSFRSLVKLCLLGL